MKNQYQKIKKINYFLITTTIAVIMFFGTVFQSQAFIYEWTDFKTINLTGTGSVTKNNNFWQISLSGVSNGGITIGSPYYTFVQQNLQTSPWVVSYEVVSASGGTCTMRATYGSTNGLTGSNLVTMVAGSATTTNLTFTSPITQNGQYGVTIHRTTGTIDCVVKIYSITNASGELIWSPTYNQSTISSQISLSTATSSGGDTYTVNTLQPETEQVFSFLILLLIYILPVVLIVYLFNLFYVRK